MVKATIEDVAEEAGVFTLDGREDRDRRRADVRGVQASPQAGLEHHLATATGPEHVPGHRCEELEEGGGLRAAPGGTDVTDAFRLYLRPLLGSDMPDAFRLRGVRVAKANA